MEKPTVFSWIQSFPLWKKEVPALADNLDDLDDELFDESFWESLGVGGQVNDTISIILKALREQSDSRKKRFEEYDKAAKDSIIGSAIEMMADDATQFDVERERTVWIESKDKKYEKKINAMLHKYVEPFIDTIAEHILRRGEFAFKVHDLTKLNSIKGKGGKGEEFDMALTPYRQIYRLHHLVLIDQTHWFVVTDDIQGFADMDQKKKEFKDDTEFLHFLNYSLDNSEEVELGIKRDGEKPKMEPVFVLQGQAILTERILETYRILQALETAVISSRLQKSKLVRFVKVNVGNKLGNEKAKAIVNYVDGLVNKNENISSSADSYTATRLQAAPVTVVLPVKDSKGDVTIDQFENTADIKEIADIDYFKNKLFAGLKTPKQYLAFDESLPGVGSAASLMRTDIRYARTVKKVQRVLVNGVKELLRIDSVISGKEIPKGTKVRIINVNSPEDEERYFEMGERMALSETVLGQIINVDTGQLDMQKIDLMIKFFTEVVPMNALRMYLEGLRSKVDVKAQPEGLEVEAV